MIEVILLAIALAMDAFAVSIGLGAKSQYQSQYQSQHKARQYIRHLAWYSALYFGIAQGVMPLFGYLLGVALLGWLASAAPWIGGTILIALGSKMLYEALKNSDEDSTDNDTLNASTASSSAHNTISHRLFFTLAVATSIDAMAAGFTLNLLSLNAWLACLIIAIVTAVFSFGGVYLGRRSGTWLDTKAEALGGIVLIAIGLKIMFFSSLN